MRSTLPTLVVCASLFLALPVVHAGPVTIDVRSSEAISPEVVEQVNQFLATFVEIDKAPAAQAALYTNDAVYFDRTDVNKSEMIKDMIRYQRQWPHRQYRLTDIEYLKLDSEADRIFVSFLINFRVSNASRTIVGSARYGATIVDLAESPKMESIQEKVINRKRVANPDG